MRRGYIILLWICGRNNGNLVCVRFYVQIANTNLLSWEKYTLFLPLLFLSLKTKLRLDFAISSSIVDVKFKPLVSLHFATLQLFFKLLAQPSSCNSMCWTGNMGHSSLTSSCPLYACQDCLKAILHTVFAVHHVQGETWLIPYSWRQQEDSHWWKTLVVAVALYF